jgi:hypothetical protein
VTYSVGVRSFFFWGDEKPKKVRDSQDPEIPTELGFQKVRYPARNGEPRNSSDGHRRLRENPENRCDPQKETLTRSSPSHGTFAKEEEWHPNANLSPCPKKSGLGEGKQTLTAVDRRNIENRQVRACFEFLTRDSGTEIG